MPYADLALRRAETVAFRLERLNQELREASAETILRASFVREWPREITYVSSFGAESACMLALIADIDPATPVLFLETGKHFAQTLDYRDELIERLGLTNVINLIPATNEVAAEDPKGVLSRENSDACCALRKVRPLDAALDGYSAWITGRKRFHGGERMRLPVFEFEHGRFKVNPLAGWTRDDVEAFFQRRNLPRHPLVAQGYPSIGCWPCTSAVESGGDVRSGRWAGLAKTECGLHVQRAERPRVF